MFAAKNCRTGFTWHTAERRNLYLDSVIQVNCPKGWFEEAGLKPSYPEREGGFCCKVSWLILRELNSDRGKYD